MPTPSQDLIDLYVLSLRERHSDETIGTYTWQLTAADRGLPYGLETATETEVRAWIWRGTYAASSRSLCHAVIAGFYRWAVAAEHLDYDPTTHIPPPKIRPGLPRVATDAQVQRLIQEAPDPYRLDAHLAAYGGLRCIEISRLDRRHITEQQITAHGKGDKFRAVPTHPEIWALVRDLPDGPLAGGRDAHAVSNGFIRYCQRQGMRGLSLHRLRGWFATSGYGATNDIRAVQVLLGHTSLATTQRYIAVGDPQRRAVITALPVFSAAADAPASPRAGS